MKILFHFFYFIAPLPIAAWAQSQPGAPQVVVSDVASFWEAYDLFWQDTTLNPFVQYLEQGSIGLKDFIPNRTRNAAALKATVARERNYYDKVRSAQTEIDNMKEQVQEVFASLKRIYPEALLPDVYFVIGRISSGGTATSHGIMIGYETFSKDEASTSWGRKSVSHKTIPATVAHELVHFQQRMDNGNDTLLKLCLREGGADFISELMGYKEIRYLNGNVYAYGELHEKELWQKFETERESLEYDDWLYNHGRIKDRPSDLGYWMGYKICSAYYDNALQKDKAILDILQIGDCEAFLRASGYRE